MRPICNVKSKRGLAAGVDSRFSRFKETILFHAFFIKHASFAYFSPSRIITDYHLFQPKWQANSTHSPFHLCQASLSFQIFFWKDLLYVFWQALGKTYCSCICTNKPSYKAKTDTFMFTRHPVPTDGLFRWNLGLCTKYLRTWFILLSSRLECWEIFRHHCVCMCVYVCVCEWLLSRYFTSSYSHPHTRPITRGLNGITELGRWRASQVPPLLCVALSLSHLSSVSLSSLTFFWVLPSWNCWANFKQLFRLS